MKSSFVVAGWALAGGVYLWAKVGWALGAIAGPTAEGPGSWVFAVWAAGLVAGIAGCVMTVTDAWDSLSRVR